MAQNEDVRAEHTSSSTDSHQDRVANIAAAMITAGLLKSVEDFSSMASKVSDAMLALNTTSPSDNAAVQRPPPAVPVKKSVHQEYLICLEDGKKLKMLKRHLKTAYNMTPEQYRERWGLPQDYPMTAPGYSERRSGLAKSNGLGRSNWRKIKKAA